MIWQSLLIGLLVFGSAIAIDVIWAGYTLAVSKLNVKRAMVMAAGISCFGVISVRAYVRSPFFVIPTAIGSAIGTGFEVRRQRDHRKE